MRSDLWRFQAAALEELEKEGYAVPVCVTDVGQALPGFSMATLLLSHRPDSDVSVAHVSQVDGRKQAPAFLSLLRGENAEVEQRPCECSSNLYRPVII